MNRAQRRASKKASRHNPGFMQMDGITYDVRAGSTLLSDDEIGKQELTWRLIISAMERQRNDANGDYYNDDHEVTLGHHINVMLHASKDSKDVDIYRLCNMVIDEMKKAQDRKRKYGKWVITQPMIDILDAFMFATFGEGGFMRRCSRLRIAKAAKSTYEYYQQCAMRESATA